MGGVVAALESNARLGKSDLMVVEGDESDRSFLMLTPTIAVVTNIDREHMDHYADMKDMRDCFAQFVNKVLLRRGGAVPRRSARASGDSEVGRRRITYGLSAQADISAHDVRYDQSFCSKITVWSGTEPMCDISLRVPGLHNVYNALASVAVALELDVRFETIAQALEEFTGVNRRFQFKGEESEVLVVDDYGHHPTEIRATLAAAKIGSAGKRIVVLFQPHRYSRTADLMEEFARAFNNADVLLVTDIYAASEDSVEGVTSEALTALITRYGHKDARAIGPIEGALDPLLAEVRAGDIVLTVGAGNVYRVGERLLEVLQERSKT
ncbi:MAG: cyanophycin synthetase [Pyrinomonadaceae bacterium]